MAGLGRKTFNSGDVLNAADVQGYLMDQAVMVFDGTASRGSAIPTPSAGMVAYSTATQLQVYDGSDWVDLSTGYGVATGGASTAVTVGGVNYTLLTFTSDSTLTVTKAGLFDVMAIGGGGAGGNQGPTNAGGGAGGMQQTTVYLSANASVQVGAGVASGATSPGITASSELNDGTTNLVLGMYGGTGGGGYGFTTSYFTMGGCGGGGTSGGPASLGLQGNGGGANNGTNTGGGGGLGAVGGAATVSVGGNGGAGIDVSTFIGGSTLLKGGGGGGSPSGTGGSGGGGASTVAGAANSGGGGGNTAAGGSGIVYVRFKV